MPPGDANTPQNRCHAASDLRATQYRSAKDEKLPMCDHLCVDKTQKSKEAALSTLPARRLNRVGQ
jgi:hypothetical protein